MNLLVWQLIDSGFPSGGFAHSAGLEASVQHGQVDSAHAVRAFARQSLSQTGRSALPLVTAAFREPCRFAELDRLADVFLVNPVANRASRAQGRSLVMSVARSFPHAPVTSLEERIRRDRLAVHYAPSFGYVFNALDVSLPDTRRAFLFVSLRSVVSAAVRLGLIGAYDAQNIHASISGDIDSVIRSCGELGAREIAQTAPLIDLFQSTHERLYSRLFQS
jgi:urease accessory protein